MTRVFTSDPFTTAKKPAIILYSTERYRDVNLSFTEAGDRTLIGVLTHVPVVHTHVHDAAVPTRDSSMSSCKRVKQHGLNVLYAELEILLR